MDSPLLTIAVAVYNTEEYLRDCMDSVVNQTYQNLEIICVNDCSTDNSLEILEEYAAKDKRIKIITNEKNLGLGVVRNIGMDAAHGEYILFIDSDDWLDLTTCEKLITKAKVNDSDVVFYFAYQVDGDKKEGWKMFCDVSYPLSLKDRKALLKEIHPQTWSKLLKLEFLKEKEIRFPDFHYLEDQKLHWMVCLLAEKVAFEIEHLYYYRKREGQLTQCTDRRRMLVIDVYDDLEKYLGKEKFFSLYRKEFQKKKYGHYFHTFLNLDPQFREEFLRKIKISFSDIFFLLTHGKLLKYGVFLIFLKSPFIGLFENLGRSYVWYRLCKQSISK